MFTAKPIWIASQKRWRLRIQVDGKEKSFYSSKESSRTGPAECQRKAREWLDRNRSGRAVRFQEAWADFMGDYSKRNRPTSANAIESRGKAHLVDRFKHKRLTDITKAEWQQVIFDAFDNGAQSKATLKGIATTIRTFCKWSASKGFIKDADVPIYFDYPRGTGTKQKRILQPAQLRLLFSDDCALSDNWYLPMFRFLALTGLRRGELCALQTDRDFDGDRIAVRESISHEGLTTSGKTDQAQRTVLLGSRALSQIATHRQQASPSRYLFSDPQGHRISPRVLRNNWQKWREANGVDITLHELRHTFITYSRKKADIALDDLKDIVGHAKKMNTDSVYVHEIEKTIEEQQAEALKIKQQTEMIDGTFNVILGQ